MDIIRSNSICPEIAPNAAKQVTIAVYGRNKIPTPSLNFFGPNFGTNHSDIRLFCNNNYYDFIFYMTDVLMMAVI